MAFAYVQLNAGSGAGGARRSAPTLGQFSVELYTFTQANTDTTGTITTQMARPLAAFVSATTSTTSDIGALVSATTNSLNIVSVGGGNSPVAGYVMVIGTGR